jgi:hypothetical protein
MAGFGAYQVRPVFQQFTARLQRQRRAAAPAAGDRPAMPFRPRGRTYYSDETTTVIGRTLISPNGMFRLADMSSYRPVPQIEPRERARDASGMCAFVIGLLAVVGIAAFATYVLMANSYGDATAAAFLGTAIVCTFILAAYVSVVLARWQVVYDRDPVRYRHVIVAVHRGESVAITPDLPYETASKIVAVLDKVKRKIPKNESQPRRQAVA